MDSRREIIEEQMMQCSEIVDTVSCNHLPCSICLLHPLNVNLYQQWKHYQEEPNEQREDEAVRVVVHP